MVVKRTSYLKIGMSAVYNTASTKTLQVITGTLPLDLEAEMQVVINTSRGMPTNELQAVRTTTKEELMNRWLNKWSTLSKDDFLKMVKDGLSSFSPLCTIG